MMTASERITDIADRAFEQAGREIEAGAAMMRSADCDFEAVRMHHATARALQAVTRMLRDTARDMREEEQKNS